MKDFREIMNEGYIPDPNEGKYGSTRQMCKRLELGDGTVLSIQASEYHYCKPRKNSQNRTYKDYDEFEIGFPSKVIEDIKPFAEDYEDLTGTVYGYVPYKIIQNFINKRGGIVGFKEVF